MWTSGYSGGISLGSVYKREIYSSLALLYDPGLSAGATLCPVDTAMMRELRLNRSVPVSRYSSERITQPLKFSRRQHDPDQNPNRLCQVDFCLPINPLLKPGCRESDKGGFRTSIKTDRFTHDSKGSKQHHEKAQKWNREQST